MTPAELLALLGRFWPRLLIYPGGLAALLAGAVILWFQRRSLRGPAPAGAGALAPLAALSAVAVPWLGLALLPLPLAASVGRSVDVIFALALLEWPRLLAAARDVEQGRSARLAAALNSYPPLIGALLLLALPGGSLDVQLLGQAPAQESGRLAGAGHWVGAAGLLLALVPALGIGPFAGPSPDQPALRLGLALRAAGVGALAALPWAGLIPEKMEWLLPLPVLGVAAAVWLLDRLGRGRAALPWARALLWLSAAELTLLLAVGAESLVARLQ
jgi:hypothetical protein